MRFLHNVHVVAIAAAIACSPGSDGTESTSETTGPTSTSSGGSSGGATEPTSSGASSGEGSSGAAESSSGSSGGSSSGSSGGADCLRCAQALAGDRGPLCAGSDVIYDAIYACVCQTCEVVCAATCTMSAPPDMACQDCQNQAFNGACMQEVAACFADM